MSWTKEGAFGLISLVAPIGLFRAFFNHSRRTIGNVQRLTNRPPIHPEPELLTLTLVEGFRYMLFVHALVAGKPDEAILAAAIGLTIELVAAIRAMEVAPPSS